MLLRFHQQDSASDIPLQTTVSKSMLHDRFCIQSSINEPWRMAVEGVCLEIEPRKT